MYDPDDTIAAIASAAGGAARGIVRLSGPRVIAILEACYRPQSDFELSSVISPTAMCGVVRLSEFGPALAGAGIEADLYLWPGTRSYTRQPLAELHTLGSPPLLTALLKRVCAAGARLAEPGEFTLRAFLAGRIDLTQAEAVLGVVDARAESELQTALSQLAGGLATPLAGVRERLIDLLAELEAGLDFAEEDIEFVSRDDVEVALGDARSMVARLESQMTGRGRHDRPPRIVLVGSPNVGKSSLFNALAKDAAAIVADEPGTTRDYLTATLDLGGVLCQLVDTAGTMPDGGGNPLDAPAQQATASVSHGGDLRLLCIDSTRLLNAWERATLAVDNSRQLVVLTKCDQAGRVELSCPTVATSATAGQGLGDLRQAIGCVVLNLDRAGTIVAVTAERSADSVRLAGEALDQALQLTCSGAGEELVAGEIRLALTELGKVAGVVHSDDVLGRIFSRFCVGK